MDFVGHRKNVKPRLTLARVRRFLVTACAFIIALGVLTLSTGRPYYSNYLGGSVFAPFSIFIGALTIEVALKSY